MLFTSRFLYPIYPLICVAASAVIESFPDLFRNKFDPHDSSIIVKVRFQFTEDSEIIQINHYISYLKVIKYTLDFTLSKFRLPKF